MFRDKCLPLLLFTIGLLAGVFTWETPGVFMAGLVQRAGGWGWKCEYWGTLENGTSWRKSDFQSDAMLHFVDDSHPVPDTEEPFYARFDGRWAISSEGDYRLISRARGGVRIWVNDLLVLDAWNPIQENYKRSRRDAVLKLEPGTHSIRIETRYLRPEVARVKVTMMREGDIYEQQLAAPIISRP